ncbi:hypothetical protein SVI_1219 [Shewanella violacea DSS12]|uniref:Uncharacterized protein n=1 Tax=Shewanella violacea (strain JCM 10179 / CIP 106290 / LMG 19151 / DSS12) TaxID=637905 RepID=D4ZHP1_SHEVD|nr:hypothetical protein SVI_1219 [Shewanella violacea DSS12]
MMQGAFKLAGLLNSIKYRARLMVCPLFFAWIMSQVDI